MAQKELVKEVQEIAEEMIDKGYQKRYKEVIVENYMKFLDNERDEYGKSKLLKVLKNVKWYSNHNTDVFFSNIVTEILDETIGEIFFVSKNKKSSSCYSIVINLLREGKTEKNHIITYNKVTKCLVENSYIKDREMKETDTILIMDDYVGSGNTIIDMIEAIEERFCNVRVLILNYVWQEAGIKNIKQYLNRELKNHYEIIEKGIVLENSYTEKFKTDEESIRYINSICDNCVDENYKYGYLQTGSMLTFNGISPNNNISMLWRTDINYNNCTWIPIFNREFSMEYLRKKKNQCLRENKKELLEIYNNSSLKQNLTFDEFKVLIILFNTYSVRTPYIKELLGFDSIEDVNNIIEKFVNCGIISYSTDNILEFIDSKIIYELKKIDERISKSVGIIKGTRKQIEKNTPLE